MLSPMSVPRATTIDDHGADRERDRDAPDRPGESSLVHRPSATTGRRPVDGRAVARRGTDVERRRRARRAGRRCPGVRSRARRPPGRSPTPSSVTSNVRAAVRLREPDRRRRGSAYFATFCSASRQEKYTAASISCG